MPIEIPPKNPRQSWMTYQFSVVNNLILFFPLGRTPFDRAYDPDHGFRLGMAIEHGYADEVYGVRWPNDCSELLATKTLRQFVQELWDLVPMIGMDLPTLSRKLNQWYLAPDDAPRDEALDKEICEAMIKIYVIMRERGYSHRDLAA